MSDAIFEQKELDRQADLARLRGLRPIDDDFMRCIFRDNIPLAQLVLRIMTGKDDLQITHVETQKDLKRLMGARSICLDALATDSNGKQYDLEIQRSDHGAGRRRARYHASAMDIENLDAGQSFDALPESYTIFVTEHDVMKKGLPVYRVERTILETEELFDDGSHILYVNGEYRDDSAIGKLMHDFSSWDPEKMNYDLMKQITRYYKETPEGVEFMCRAFEETRQEGWERGMQQGNATRAIDDIRNLMRNLKLTATQAMDALSVKESDRSEYLKLLNQ